MKQLSKISVYPIKSLDPEDQERISTNDYGGLSHDRSYAIVDENGEYINGKQTALVHEVRVDHDFESDTVTLSTEESPKETYHLTDDRASIEEWLSDHFGKEISLLSESGGKFTDGVVYGENTNPGPTLVSEATLREVSSWFDGIDPDEIRLRLRPNLVISGVPAFWEEKLVMGEKEQLCIGDIHFEGEKVVPRCVVPSRDPHTGESYDGFRSTFLEMREKTLPDWASKEDYGHYFKLTVGLEMPASERGKELSIGDEVRLV